MVDALQDFFRKYILADRQESKDLPAQQLRLAVAALLLEMARIDFEVEERELQTAAQSLKDKFKITDEEAAALLALSRERAGQHTSYYEFTSLLNKLLSAQQKINVVEHLWKVAYTDGTLSPHEDHFVRKIADLIYVPHSEFIAAKLRARPA